MSEPTREFDVAVFGASGVTGREVARYLTEVDANWAAVGRDTDKLMRTLAAVDAGPAGTLEAEIDDPDSLAEMARRAKVVLNLVGPYTTRGRPVIAACVEAGAHYVDLTGEIPFVRDTIAEFDVAAREAGVKVVQVCGFEALPPDLAVQLAADAVRERFNDALAEIDVAVSVTRQPSGIPRASDMISGGTFQSMAEAVGSTDPSVLTDPAALIADPSTAAAVRARSPIAIRPRRDATGTPIGPMTPAAFINPAVIQRTAAVIAAERGVALEPFRYREGVAIDGPGWSLPVRMGAATALATTQLGMRAAALARPAVRERVAGGLRRVLPGSGFGPSADRIGLWSWRLDVAARGRSGHEVAVAVEAEGHPGYLTTSRMFGEAGLMLAEPGATPDRTGCLTPALALGTERIDRFDRARLRFSVS